MGELLIIFGLLFLVLGVPTLIVVMALTKIDREEITPPPNVIRKNLAAGFLVSFWGIDFLVMAVPIIILFVLLFAAERINSDIGAGIVIGDLSLGLIMLFIGRTIVGFQTRRINFIKGRERTVEEEKILSQMFVTEGRQSDVFFQNVASATPSLSDDIVNALSNTGIISSYFAAGKAYTGHNALKNHAPAIVISFVIILVLVRLYFL